MNRPIEFRGKCVTTGEWVYGDLVHNAFDGTSRNIPIGIKPDGSYPIEVITETVGQLVRVDNVSGQKYFEGDIDQYGDVIMYCEDVGLFALHSHLKNIKVWVRSSYPIDFSRVKITGTIHDK